MWLRDSVWLRERETLAAAAVTQQRRQFADNKKKYDTFRACLLCERSESVHIVSVA